jgi:hypothetical protein
MIEPNGQVTEGSLAADPRKKLETFVRVVVSSKQMQSGGGMLGAMLASALPLMTTMLERAQPETVAGYSGILAQAFGLIANPAVTEEQFASQLTGWTAAE